jgi:N-acetylglucosamine-6-sulfatase
MIRRGAMGALVALVALVAVVVTAPRAATGQERPDMMAIQRASLRPASGAGVADGRVTVRITVHSPHPEPLTTALVSGTATLLVRDARAFAVATRLPPCTPRAAGGLRCRSGDGLVRLAWTPTPTSGVYELRGTLRRLGSAVTGTSRPVGPVRVQLDPGTTNAPADLATACARSPRGGLVCDDSRGPNIILINTDDQRWDTLPYMPTVWSRLVPEGVTFTNAFVSSSVCCPSRASLLSGLFAHNHGVLSIAPPSGGAPRFVGRDASTIAVWLQDAGYRTGLFGKYLNGYELQGPPNTAAWYVPPGWDVWRALAPENYYGYLLVREDRTAIAHGSAPEDYSTHVLAADLEAYVADSLAAKRPFFAYFAPYAPHISVATLLPIPAPGQEHAFDAFPLPQPPSFNEDDVSDKPLAVQRLAPLSGFDVPFLGVSVRAALASCLAVDEVVANLLHQVEAAGQADNTVIVYTSDNGLAWGEHRYRGKDLPYEEIIRVPLVVHAPGRVAPHVDPGFTMNVDLAPTLAELAGVLPPTRVDGRALGPLLAAPGRAVWDDVIMESWTTGGSPRFFGIRTDRWKYVEWPGTAEHELYDLDADPYELTNVFPDAGHEDVIAALAAALHARTTPQP